MVPGKVFFTVPVALPRTNPVGMSPWSFVSEAKQNPSPAGGKINTKTVPFSLGSRGFSGDVQGVKPQGSK